MLDSIIRICEDYDSLGNVLQKQLYHILTNDEWGESSYNISGFGYNIIWFLNQVLDFINEHDESVFSISGQKKVGSVFEKDIEKIEELIIKIELIVEEDDNETS